MMMQRDDIDAERFAESLDALDEGRDPGVDALEDPGLSLDLEAAKALRVASAAVEPRATYRERSRALLLQSMREASGGKPAAIPFYRRWGLVFAPVAAAAAAAAISVAVLGGSSSAPTATPAPEQLAAVAPESAPRQVAFVDPFDEESTARPATAVTQRTNQTATSGIEELDRIAALLEEINERAGGGELVDASLLRAVTEHTSKLAAQIDAEPDTLSPAAVVTFIKAAAASRTVLEQAAVAPEHEDALDAARKAADDGVLVASNYFALRSN